jgi:phosphoserine aminotransferase
LNYATHAENGSMYNTPPCFGIYLMGLVMKWARAEGGLEAIAARNERKAAALYAEIDRTGFYRGTAETASRSRMNVTFRLPSEELEAKFVKASTAAGLDGLKGHRSVGGMRSSSCASSSGRTARAGRRRSGVRHGGARHGGGAGAAGRRRRARARVNARPHRA